MNEARLRKIEQVEALLVGSAPVTFSTAGDDLERYAFIRRTLHRFDYPRRSKHDGGVLHRYIKHVTSYRRAQISRLIPRWKANRPAHAPLSKQT